MLAGGTVPLTLFVLNTVVNMTRDSNDRKRVARKERGDASRLNVEEVHRWFVGRQASIDLPWSVSPYLELGLDELVRVQATADLITDPNVRESLTGSLTRLISLHHANSLSSKLRTGLSSTQVELLNFGQACSATYLRGEAFDHEQQRMIVGLWNKADRLAIETIRAG